MLHQRWLLERQQKTPRQAEGFCESAEWKSAEADLGEDALAGQKLSAEADDESHHGEAAIPGFSERREAELGVHSVIKKPNNHTGLLVRSAYPMWQELLLSGQLNS